MPKYRRIQNFVLTSASSLISEQPRDWTSATTNWLCSPRFTIHFQKKAGELSLARIQYRSALAACTK